MSRAFAIVLVVAMTSGGAAAQPVSFTTLLHQPAREIVVRRTLVHTAVMPIGAEQARGLLIAALLIGAARSR